MTTPQEQLGENPAKNYKSMGDFFRHASPEEQMEVARKAAEGANEDQRELMRRYNNVRQATLREVREMVEKISIAAHVAYDEVWLDRNKILQALDTLSTQKE